MAGTSLSRIPSRTDSCEDPEACINTLTKTAPKVQAPSALSDHDKKGNDDAVEEVGIGRLEDGTSKSAAPWWEMTRRKRYGSYSALSFATRRPSHFHQHLHVIKPFLQPNQNADSTELHRVDVANLFLEPSVAYCYSSLQHCCSALLGGNIPFLTNYLRLEAENTFCETSGRSQMGFEIFKVIKVQVKTFATGGQGPECSTLGGVVEAIQRLQRLYASGNLKAAKHQHINTGRISIDIFDVDVPKRSNVTAYANPSFSSRASTCPRSIILFLNKSVASNNRQIFPPRFSTRKLKTLFDAYKGTSAVSTSVCLMALTGRVRIIVRSSRRRNHGG
ncbi:hypothetical protein C8R45DRAFT_1080557 [Mycena sanguinolenta]|nr:hypothetical protein C8R45DRAFT_1182656 [Mycena sanguinolenta]KAJ6463015.1 hypothetical protein C8R45DRAFT_1080557 [Mycena sanguinolenta]